MRKSQIVLLSMLAAGVLITGIGAGTAFVEYSSMEYEGTVTMGEEHWKTDTFICEWEPEKGQTLWIDTDNYPWWDTELVEDESIPAGEVAVDITYNEAVYKPHVSLEPVVEWSEVTEEAVMAEPETAEATETSTEEPERETETETEPETEPETAQPEKIADRLEIWISYEGNFDVLMEHKDQVLSMLKDGKFASFEMATVKDVTIRIHPDMMEYVDLDAE